MVPVDGPKVPVLRAFVRPDVLGGVRRIGPLHVAEARTLFRRATVVKDRDQWERPFRVTIDICGGGWRSSK